MDHHLVYSTGPDVTFDMVDFSREQSSYVVTLFDGTDTTMGKMYAMEHQIVLYLVGDQKPRVYPGDIDLKVVANDVAGQVN